MNAPVRIVTSINWLLGTLAVGAAILIPILRERVVVEAARKQAEMTVTQIVRKEHDHFVTRGERYAPFTTNAKEAKPTLQGLGLALDAGDFVYDAGMNTAGQLVVRAFTAKTAMTKGSLPPLFYRYTLPRGAEEGTGEWVALTRRSPGLHNLLPALGLFS